MPRELHLSSGHIFSSFSNERYQRPSKTRHEVLRTSSRTGWRTARSLLKTLRHHRCLSQLLPTLLPSSPACAHSKHCAPIPPPISARHSLWHHSAVKFPVFQSNLHVAELYWDWRVPPRKKRTRCVESNQARCIWKIQESQSGRTVVSVSGHVLYSRSPRPRRNRSTECNRVQRGHSIPVLGQSDEDPWDIRYYGNNC